MKNEGKVLIFSYLFNLVFFLRENPFFNYIKNILKAAKEKRPDSSQYLTKCMLNKWSIQHKIASALRSDEIILES